MGNADRWWPAFLKRAPPRRVPTRRALNSSRITNATAVTAASSSESTCTCICGQRDTDRTDINYALTSGGNRSR